MHTLSTFPQLLTFGLIAPLLLRLGVGLFLVYLAKERYNKIYKWSFVVYLISGILLILGLYTQIASIVSILVISFDFYTDKDLTPFSTEKKILYIIMKVILLSLLFTGPGFLAFDLPL